MLNKAVVDLSHHNTVTSFAAMAADGVVGIIHKATEGATVRDSQYAQRRPLAEGAGLLWGAYHFLRPGDMIAQAAHFARTAGDAPLLAADHEDAGVSLGGLKTFLSEVLRLTGKRAVIYSGHMLKDQLGDEEDQELAPYRLWLAHYANTPSWPTATWPQWWLWQWTDKAICKGAYNSEGCVDANRYAGTPEELRAEWTGEPPVVEDVVVRITIDAPPRCARGGDAGVRYSPHPTGVARP